MENLVIILVQGSTLIGKLDIDKNRLIDPMRFLLIKNPSNPKEGAMALEGLPGNPAFLALKNYGFYYPVKDENMIGMYLQATTGIELPGKGVIKQFERKGMI